MPFFSSILNRHPVYLDRRTLYPMVRLIKSLHCLSTLPSYQKKILPQSPEVARFSPGHDSVMMGYDFHLSPQGPRLIEVNTNAGGGLLAYLSHLPVTQREDLQLPPRLHKALLSSFSEEIRRFTQGDMSKPNRIVILDENPEDQFLFPEMQAFAKMFELWGVQAEVADPGDIVADGEGVFLRGQPVDLIYNRHCDFYLETEVMAGIREAYLAGRVCLTPNPHTYALLADKRRMVLWSDTEQLQALALENRIISVLTEQIPRSRMLSDLGLEKAWEERKNVVFKPVSRFGSRGVYLGKKISRKHFADLPPQETLVQAFVPPSQVDFGGDSPHKVDFRLFAYRNRTLGLAARLYRGQVTNLSSEGSGFAPVLIR